MTVAPKLTGSMIALGLAFVALAVLMTAAFLAFRRLGFRPEWAALLVVAVGVGGRFDLPLSRRTARVGLNVGGAVVPLVVAGDQIARLLAPAWAPLAIATGVVALASFALARPTPGVGMLLP